MSLKKIKKKQKLTHSIPPHLIAGKRHKDIIKILSAQSTLTDGERYLYGYSLFHTQKAMKSLITLWPLVAKGHAALQKDCAVIAEHVFSDEKHLSSTPLCDEDLYALLFAGKTLAPESQAYQIIKSRFCTSLWEKGEYEKLERTLKSLKEKFSGILLENLSKLAFFQPEKKMTGNIQAFASHILTGGGCLMLRNADYHCDLENGIQRLANELKQLFFRLKSKGKLSWNKSLFECFVDYEARVLTQILQLAVNDPDWDNNIIIPTPSYLMLHDAMNNRVAQHFLPWLAEKNKALAQLYDPDIYAAIIYALTGEKLSSANNLSKLVQQHKLNPYLRFALMLRADDNKQSCLKDLVQISDFKNQVPSLLHQAIIIQTIKSMINGEAKKPLASEFWGKLYEFYPVIQTAELKHILVKQALCQLQMDCNDRLSLDLDTLKNNVNLIAFSELEKDVDTLCQRQAECWEFLLSLNKKTKSKNMISAIKGVPALHAHLSLIADTSHLLYSHLSRLLFLHINSLVTNKRINTLLPLADSLDFPFDCDCPDCQHTLYRNKIPALCEQFALPLARLPECSAYAELKSTPETQVSNTSVLSQPNPFKMLDVTPKDSKSTIMKRVMELIRKSPKQMPDFRKAQNALFNPSQNFLYHYFYFLAEEDKNIASEANPTTCLHKFPLQDELFT